MSSPKKRRSRKAKSIVEEKPPASHRLHILRQRLWGAAGVASCVEYASASTLAPSGGKPDFENTMTLLHDYLNEIAGELEAIVDELGGPPDVVDES